MSLEVKLVIVIALGFVLGVIMLGCIAFLAQMRSEIFYALLLLVCGAVLICALLWYGLERYNDKQKN